MAEKTRRTRTGRDPLERTMEAALRPGRFICECGGKFRILSFITEPKVITKILDHLQKRPSSLSSSSSAAPLSSRPS